MIDNFCVLRGQPSVYFSTTLS